MNYYLVAKLVHILGALGFFIALGAEWLSLWHAQHAATTEQVRERLHISNSAQRLGPPSMLLILISGIYMMTSVWGGVPWIIIAPSIKTEGKLFQIVQSVGKGTR